MGLEYHTGYCKDCKADRKLERKKPNHILHFIITVLLGSFTYGIGSIAWLVVWFIISAKFSDWTCSECGSNDNNFNIQNTTSFLKPNKNKTDQVYNFASDTKFNVSKKAMIIIALVIAIITLIIFFMPSFNESQSSKKSTTSSSKSSSQQQEPSNQTEQENAYYDEEVEEQVDEEICSIVNKNYSENLLEGETTCKKGKLIIKFYDKSSQELVGTKVIMFKGNKFSFRFENSAKVDAKFSIVLKKEQIEERLEQIKAKNEAIINQKNESISDINFYNEKCKVKSWKYKKSTNDLLTITGTTSCESGKLTVQIYDENNKYIGEKSSTIQSKKFTILLTIDTEPSSLKVHYTINEQP